MPPRRIRRVPGSWPKSLFPSVVRLLTTLSGKWRRHLRLAVGKAPSRLRAGGPTRSRNFAAGAGNGRRPRAVAVTARVDPRWHGGQALCAELPCLDAVRAIAPTADEGRTNRASDCVVHTTHPGDNKRGRRGIRSCGGVDGHDFAADSRELRRCDRSAESLCDRRFARASTSWPWSHPESFRSDCDSSTRRAGRLFAVARRVAPEPDGSLSQR